MTSGVQALLANRQDRIPDLFRLKLVANVTDGFAEPARHHQREQTF